MAPVLKAARIPTFVSGIIPESVLKQSDYLFTTNPVIRDEAVVLAEYAFNKLNLRRGFTIEVGTQWGENFADQFKSRFEELGGKVLGDENVAIESTDYRSELTRAKSQKPDFIFVVHVGPILGNIIKQIRLVGMNQRILTTDEAEVQSVLDSAGSSAEGLTYFATTPSNEDLNFAKFRNEYTKRYGTLPSILSANAYDATLLTIETLQKCNFSPECVKEQLALVKDYPGSSGTFSIVKSGGAKKSFHLRVVKNGKFQDGN